MSTPMSTKTSTFTETRDQVRAGIYEFVSTIAQHLLDAVGSSRALEFSVYAKYAGSGRWNFVMNPRKMEDALTMKEKNMLKQRYNMVPMSRGKMDIFVVDDDAYKKQRSATSRRDYNALAGKIYPAKRGSTSGIPTDAPFTRYTKSHDGANTRRSRGGGGADGGGDSDSEIYGALDSSDKSLFGTLSAGLASLVRVLGVLLTPVFWLGRVVGIQAIFRLAFTIMAFPARLVLPLLRAGLPSTWNPFKSFRNSKKRRRGRSSGGGDDSDDDDDDDDDASISMEQVPTSASIRTRRQKRATERAAPATVPPALKWAIKRLGVGSIYGVLWVLFVLFQLASLAILLHVNPDRYAFVLHHLFYWVL